VLNQIFRLGKLGWPAGAYAKACPIPPGRRPTSQHWQHRERPPGFNQLLLGALLATGRRLARRMPLPLPSHNNNSLKDKHSSLFFAITLLVLVCWCYCSILLLLWTPIHHPTPAHHTFYKFPYTQEHQSEATKFSSARHVSCLNIEDV